MIETLFFLGCNEHLVAQNFTGTGEPKEYVSPGFPHYGNSIFCKIEIISTEKDKCVEIDFKTFDVEYASDCRYTYTDSKKYSTSYYISPIDIGLFWAMITYFKSRSKSLNFSL